MKSTTVLTDVSAPGVAASVGPGDEPLHLLTLHHHHLAILSSPDSLHSTCFPLHHSPTKAPFHRDVLTSLVDDQVNMYPTDSNLHNQAVRTCEGREEREKGREREGQGGGCNRGPGKSTTRLSQQDNIYWKPWRWCGDITQGGGR